MYNVGVGLFLFKIPVSFTVNGLNTGESKLFIIMIVCMEMTTTVLFFKSTLTQTITLDKI